VEPEIGRAGDGVHMHPPRRQRLLATSRRADAGPPPSLLELLEEDSLWIPSVSIA
jgi:hypothetical protein